MSARIPRSASTTGRKITAGRVLAVAAMIGPMVLLALAPNAGAFTPKLTPGYSAGCQGVSTGTKIFSSSGTTSGGTYTYSNSLGTSKGSEGARSHGSPSAIYAGAYYFVGPSAGSGCIYSSTSSYNLRMTWTWKVWVDPYLSANCTAGDNSTATATVDVLNLGNVHWGGYPYYIFIPHRQSSPDPYVAKATCAAGTSMVVSPGWIGPINVTFRSPYFSLSAGQDYDIYSSVYANNTASASSGSHAVALVTLRAHLASIACRNCPP